LESNDNNYFIEVMESVGDSAIVLQPGNYIISKNITVYRDVIPNAGVNIVLLDSSSITFKGKFLGVPYSEYFTIVEKERSNIFFEKNSEYYMSWFRIKSDGTESCSRIVNNILENANEVTNIYIEPNCTYLVKDTINIKGKNFVSFIGSQRGEISNIDDKPVNEWGNRGSRFVLDEKNGCGFRLQPFSRRTSGLCFKNLSISGFSGTKIKQIGIDLQNDNDGTIISEVSFINFHGNLESTALIIKGADAAQIRDCWISENSNCVFINYSKDCDISGNFLGAQPNGTTLRIENSISATVNSNHIYPDGSSNIIIYKSSYCLISNNMIFSRFTGIILIIHSEDNMISNNIIKAPGDNLRDWKLGKDLWRDGTSDPNGRSINYGVIRMESSRYNTITGNNIYFYANTPDVSVFNIDSESIKNEIYRNIINIDRCLRNDSMNSSMLENTVICR